MDVYVIIHDFGDAYDIGINKITGIYSSYDKAKKEIELKKDYEKIKEGQYTKKYTVDEYGYMEYGQWDYDILKIEKHKML